MWNGPGTVSTETTQRGSLIGSQCIAVKKKPSAPRECSSPVPVPRQLGAPSSVSMASENTRSERIDTPGEHCPACAVGRDLPPCMLYDGIVATLHPLLCASIRVLCALRTRHVFLPNRWVSPFLTAPKTRSTGPILVGFYKPRRTGTATNLHTYICRSRTCQGTPSGGFIHTRNMAAPCICLQPLWCLPSVPLSAHGVTLCMLCTTIRPNPGNISMYGLVTGEHLKAACVS